jgi:peptide deformylase
MGTRQPILTLPDDRLHAPNRAVKLPDRGLRRLVDDMVVTMRLARGLGLAAPQVGESLRLAVVEVEGRLYVLGNPTIVRSEGSLLDWEGCLSVPDRVAQVARASDVVVAADDIEGRHVRYRGKALLARAFQHEVDHLAGRLYVELVDPADLVDTREHPPTRLIRHRMLAERPGR